MIVSKNEIKEWMVKNDHSRRWLANKCGVSIETLSNWFSKSGEIPEKQIHRISKLIIDNNIQKQNLVLSFSLDEFRLIEAWAYKSGALVHDHAEQALIKLARNEIPDLEV